MPRFASVVLCVAVVLALAAPSLLGAEPEPSAEEIVKRMQARYAAMESYSDEGHVVSFFESDNPFTSEKSFSTAFVRPGHLRFQFTRHTGPLGQSDDNLYVVWAAGKEARSWWTTTGELVTHESIERALAGPTGISSQAVVMITGLLLPEHQWSSPLEGIQSPFLAGTERVGDHECFRIEATVRNHAGPWTIWIDREVFLVRRVERESYSGCMVRTTMSFAPVADPTIPLTTFEFTPSE